jgi:hypothetical protein
METGYLVPSRTRFSPQSMQRTRSAVIHYVLPSPFLTIMRLEFVTRVLVPIPLRFRKAESRVLVTL